MASGRKFAVFDIDGTLIRWQLYHALADALAKNSHIDAKTYAAIRDARMQWKQRSGLQSFSEYQVYVIKAYEETLLKLTPRELEQAVDDVFNEYKDQVYIFTRGLIKQLKDDGYTLFAISGSQTEIIAKIADYYGFDDYVATEYTVKSGKLQKIFPAADKKKALMDLVKKHQVGFAESVAVGDSAGDIPMLEDVEEPLVFNPDDELFKYADEKSWKIIIERKNMVYELEKSSGKYQLVKTTVG